MTRLAAVALAFACAAPSLAQSTSTLEAELRALDAAQRAAIVAGDARAMEALSHRNLRVNAPSNRVMTREEVLAMIKSGAIAAERFERTPESVTITGDVGVVMGSERIVPTATSESGRLFGVKPLDRRYTNVYLREGGKWRFLARHANVVLPREP
jgi:hypothetical protein